MTSFQTCAGPLPVDPGEALLLLDPQDVSNPTGDGEVVTVRSPWELRVAVEQRVRHRSADQGSILLHVAIAGWGAAEDLPFDLSQLPLVAFNPALPPNLSRELPTLPVAAVRALISPGTLDAKLAAAARELTGAPWPPDPRDALASVLRLLPVTPPGFRAALTASCPSGIARDLLASADPAFLLASAASDPTLEADFRQASREVAELADAGFVTLPGDTPQHLPSEPGPTELREAVDSLLAIDVHPGTLEGWRAVASQWADVRAELSGIPLSDDGSRALAELAWTWWDGADSAWGEWLRSNYGRELTRSGVVCVHRIAQFLAQEVARTGSRVVLLVIDGLGVSQWRQICALAGITPLDERLLLAGLPTITSVSRQSIFSGRLPLEFRESLDRTDTEGAAWSRFWRDQQESPACEAWYHKTTGRDRHDWVDPPATAVACGIVVNAVDEMMHGAAVNGDHQLASGVAIWESAGYLAAAGEWAQRHSAQLWITADHGNLPARGLERAIPNEGVRSTRGQRVRRFETLGLLASSSLPGIPWVPPGYPAAGRGLLFAAGRDCYQRGGIAVTHGSLSLDEAFVPFARLT